MSENNDAASKTEEPTARKLEQAREKGDVVKTMDLGTFATLAAASGVIALAGGWLSSNMTIALRPFIERPHAISMEGGGGVDVARQAMLAAAPFMEMVLGAVMVAGVAANLLQTGLMVTPEKLKPDWKKVSPMAGFKRIFGLDGLAQFLKSLIKVGLTALIGWWILEPFTPKLIALVTLEPIAMLPFSAEVLRKLVFAICALALVVAGADWLWQRQRFMKRMMMSREELKEDFKQSEGDPHVRARQRQIRMDRARRRMIQAVPGATVLVMNPTHYAVALKYDAAETAAPLCVAKGMDAIALRIRAVAEEAGVPVIEDAPLARALYAAVEVDEMIPHAHYEAVAKIIGFILNGGRRARAKSL